MTGPAGAAAPAPGDLALTTWTRRHVLSTEDWTRSEIELVLENTAAMREILSRPVRRAPPLRGRTVVLFFAEASTRTRVSFELAAKALSADVVNISAAGSSVEKGERSEEHTSELQSRLHLVCRLLLEK